MVMLVNCVGGPSKTENQPDGWIEVTGMGASFSEAETDARLRMIEWGLGVFAKSESVSVDAQSKYRYVSSYTSGYVRDFQKLSQAIDVRGIYTVLAKGRVDVRGIGNSFQERIHELGHPRVLVFLNEEILGQRRMPDQSDTSFRLISYLNEKGYKTKDQEAYQKNIAKDQNLRIGVFGNQSLEEKVLRAAAEQNSELIVLGDIKIINGGPVRKGSPLNSYQGNFRFKILNVGTGDVIASVAPSTVIQPDINDAAGPRSVIEKAMSLILPDIDKQIIENYKSGGTVSVVFPGMDTTEFTTARIAQALGEIRGVNGVYERGDAGSGMAVDVECFMSAPDLKNALVYQSWRFGKYKIQKVDLKGNRLYLTLGK